MVEVKNGEGTRGKNAEVKGAKTEKKGGIENG